MKETPFRPSSKQISGFHDFGYSLTMVITPFYTETLRLKNDKQNETVMFFMYMLGYVRKHILDVSCYKMICSGCHQNTV